MKSTGVVRQLDALGRVVIPIEIRRTMDINEKDMLEIYVNGEEIVLKNISRAVFSAGRWRMSSTSTRSSYAENALQS